MAPFPTAGPGGEGFPWRSAVGTQWAPPSSGLPCSSAGQEGNRETDFRSPTPAPSPVCFPSPPVALHALYLGFPVAFRRRDGSILCAYSILSRIGTHHFLKTPVRVTHLLLTLEIVSIMLRIKSELLSRLFLCLLTTCQSCINFAPLSSLLVLLLGYNTPC